MQVSNVINSHPPTAARLISSISFRERKNMNLAIKTWKAAAGFLRCMQRLTQQFTVSTNRIRLMILFLGISNHNEDSASNLTYLKLKTKWRLICKSERLHAPHTVV